MAIKALTSANFDSALASTDKLTVVDFSADWCGPCKMLAPVMEDVAEELQDVAFFQLNVDENPEPATRFGIDTIPCVIFFKNSEAVGKSVGFVDKATMIRRISAYI